MPRPKPDWLGAIFERAVSLDPDARETFLEHACGGDPRVRDELGSLLAAHDASCGYFERLAERVVAPALLAIGSTPDHELVHGDTVSHYRIIERIGGGGMGVVYSALDVSLDRRVALKFPPRHLSSDAAQARLLAEARAASRLDHPNIGIIHEVAEAADGRLFIAMAHYEGETLDRRIDRGPMSIDEATRIARQIAAALAAAHDGDVIHRDVKPSNILITSHGVVKLLDFGIATLARSEATGSGAAPGTVAYMSPEQTRGEPADHRTDVWSLGVVFFEMLTGVRPFRGHDDRAIVHAIRHDPWSRPIDCELPAALTRVVGRCLEKNPHRRYAHAAQLLAEIAAAATSAGIAPGVAPLPEAYASCLKGRYFLDKRDETSVRKARDHFGHALDVDPTYAPAWTGWADMLDALVWLSMMSPEDAYPQSRAAAERALLLAPELPDAHVSLARVLFRHDFEFETAADHLRCAMRLDRNHAEARQLYAAYLRIRGRFDDALEEIRTAAALDPLSPMNQIEIGITLYMARRYDEALAHYEQVLLIRPDFTSAHFFTALVYLQQQRYEEAFATLDRAAPSTHWEEVATLRAFVHARTGRHAAARAHLDALDRLPGKPRVSPWYRAIVHLGMGEHDRAVDLLARAFDQRSWQIPLLPVEPMFDPLRSNPRFIALVDRLGR